MQTTLDRPTVNRNRRRSSFGKKHNVDSVVSEDAEGELADVIPIAVHHQADAPQPAHEHNDAEKEHEEAAKEIREDNEAVRQHSEASDERVEAVLGVPEASHTEEASTLSAVTEDKLETSEAPRVETEMAQIEVQDLAKEGSHPELFENGHAEASIEGASEDDAPLLESAPATVEEGALQLNSEVAHTATENFENAAEVADDEILSV
jgi:hypothetical protein